MTEAHDVLVAGAGIAGLALMRALHQRHIDALAIEQRDSLADAGLAINLPGNAIAALGSLGLGDAIQAHGRPVQRREYRTEKGRLLFAVDERAFWGEALTPRCMRRGELAALLEHGLPTGSILRDTRIVSSSVDTKGAEVFVV